MKLAVWIEHGQGSYSVRWWKDGKKQREWVPDYATAQKRKSEIRLSLRQGSPTESPSELFEEYLRNSPKPLRPNTVKMKRAEVLPFLLGFTRLDEISSSAIRKWRDTALPKYSPDTVSIRLRNLRTFLKWANNRGFMAFNPFEGVSIPQGREVGRKLEIESLHKLLEVADSRFKPYLYLMIHLGFRRNELLEAKWADFDLKAGSWTIPVGIGRKGKKPRVLPLPQESVQWLDAQERTGPGPFSNLSESGVRFYLKKAAKLSGISGRLRVHDLRHTFASHFISNGGDPLHLMRIMGWESLAMAKRYTHLNLDDVKKSLGHFGIGAELGRFHVTS